MTFVISTLKTFFVLLNILSFLSAAVYLGFGAFMLISAYDVMGFGLKQLSLVLLCTGAGIIVFTTIGFCAGSGRRSIAMQFYSICLLLGAIYQVGFGVLSLIRRSKTEDYMDGAWNDLSEGLRDAFETAHNCCGFKSTNDRTMCPESRVSTAVACSTKLSGRQNDLFTWLTAAIFTFAMLTFLNYLVAYSLTRQYAKAKRQFKLKEAERRKSATEAKTDKSSEIKKKYSIDEKSTDEPLKSVFVPPQRDHLKFLPEFLKPTPKPSLSPKSTASMLTYEQIAAKYRNK